jgi:hypothetical protein
MMFVGPTRLLPNCSCCGGGRYFDLVPRLAATERGASACWYATEADMAAKLLGCSRLLGRMSFLECRNCNPGEPILWEI